MTLNRKKGECTMSTRLSFSRRQTACKQHRRFFAPVTLTLTRWPWYMKMTSTFCIPKMNFVGRLPESWRIRWTDRQTHWQVRLKTIPRHVRRWYNVFSYTASIHINYLITRTTHDIQAGLNCGRLILMLLWVEFLWDAPTQPAECWTRTIWTAACFMWWRQMYTVFHN